MTIPPPISTPQCTRLLALPPPILTTLIAHLLSTCARANDLLPTRGPITRFHAKVKPPLRIADYLSRLTVYTPFPRDAVLLSLLYLDRISRLHLPSSPPPTPLFPSLSFPPRPSSHAPTPLLNSFTLHRLLMATLLCSTKFTSDGHVPQSRAAKVGGVALRELVRLEVEVMFTLEWSLWYEMSEVEEVCKALLELGEEMGIVVRAEEVERPVEEELGASDPLPEVCPLPDGPPLLPFDSPLKRAIDSSSMGLDEDEEEEDDDERGEPEWQKVLAALEGARTFEGGPQRESGKELLARASCETVRAGRGEAEETGEPLEVC